MRGGSWLHSQDLPGAMFIATLAVVIANRKKRHTTDSFFLFSVRVAKIWKGEWEFGWLGGGDFQNQIRILPLYQTRHRTLSSANLKTPPVRSAHKRSCIGCQPTHNSGTMEALSNASKVETMRMLNGLEMFGSFAMAEAMDKVLSWIYTFYRKRTKNDRPRAYMKALEALVEVIEKDNTNEQRKAILSVKNILTYVMNENAEMLQIIFEENDNETNDSRIIFAIHLLMPLKFYCKLYAKKLGISIKYL